jgi:hypothetical protein
VLGEILVAIALAAVFWRTRHAEDIWLVPTLILLAAIPLAVIIYNGDAIGVDRHSIVVGITARLSLIVLGLFFLDALMSTRLAGEVQRRAKEHITPARNMS